MGKGVDPATLAAGQKLVGRYKGQEYHAEILRMEPFLIKVEGVGEFPSMTKACNSVGAADSGNRFWSHIEDAGEARAPRAAGGFKAQPGGAGPVVTRKLVSGPIVLAKAGPGWNTPVHPAYCADCACKVLQEEDGTCANCGGPVGVERGEAFYCSGCREVFYSKEEWPEACPAGHRDASLPPLPEPEPEVAEAEGDEAEGDEEGEGEPEAPPASSLTEIQAAARASREMATA